MDGTLWDSSENVAKSWDMAIAETDYVRDPLTMEDMQRVMGKTMDKIAEILFPDVSEEKRIELLDLCCQKENDYLREHGGNLYPKLRETMEELKKSFHLYIVSNCQSGYIEAFLDHYQLWDLFEDIECYGNNQQVKSYNIRFLAERNSLDRAAYVGDIQGDYDATKEAGYQFIHAAYGFGTIDEEVPAIKSLSELPAVAETVFK